MLRYGLLFALLCARALVSAQQQPDARDLEQFHVVYEWYKLDYTWPDDSTKARALSSAQFVPENNAISSAKIYRDRLYLTVPRWREGIPATLVSIPLNTQDKNASPKLEPFPSWGMQEVGNCTAFQFVQNVEVDTEGRMWVLDTGRVNVMGRSEQKCPPKLVIIELDRNNNNNNNNYNNPSSGYQYNNNNSARLVRSYVFPETVYTRDATYLADLVLDPSDGWYAYITDGGDADPGIIVYSFRENTSWKVRDNRSMVADPATRSFNLNGQQVDIQQNVYPLALDLQQQLIYYSPLSSRNLYSMPTSALKDPHSRDGPGSVRDLGKKLGLSEGFAMDNRGVLYYGLIDDNGIARWDTKTPFTTNQHVISRDNVRLQWPSGFGFDNNGYLYLVSNRMQNYLGGRVNLNEPNYRVVRGLTGSKSYLYTEMREGENWASSTYATDRDENTLMLSGEEGRNGTRNGAVWMTATPLAVLAAYVAAISVV